MKSNASVMEIIKKRRSVRTYAKKAVEQEKRDIIKKEMENIKGKNYRFEIIDFNLQEGTKLGTYGIIKGASTFIIGILDKKSTYDKHTAVDFGYSFEEIVLKSTDLGLGTCWMAGTFNSKDIMKIISLKDTEQVVMVSPIGYGDKIRGVEKLTRFVAKSDKRKPWEELFFYQDFNTPLSRDEAGEYGEVLDMVRLAPSAGNKQPWRILKTNTSYDIYTARTSFSEKEGQKINVTYNDIGIAKAHFEYSAKEKGLKGYWVENKNDNSKEEKFTYVCSWQWGEQ